jgi:hypothetical protein
MARIILVLFAVLVVCSLAAGARSNKGQLPSDHDTPKHDRHKPKLPWGQRTKRQASAQGRWHSRHLRSGEQRMWHGHGAQLQDDSVKGRVTIVGGPVDEVNVDGHVQGNRVSGVIVDDNGTQLGTFSGAVSATGVAGTFTAINGETGDWGWDGQLPTPVPPEQ